MQPPYHNIEEFINRTKKLHEIKELGIDPYPHNYNPTHTLKEISDEFENKETRHSDDAASGSTPEVSIAGRLILFRAMGKNAFAHIQDATGKVQIMFNRDLTKVVGFSSKEELALKFIEKKFDLGDIIGVKGNIFRTQKGELTVFAKEVTLLCKALLPLPDKHSGLADKGVRYRKRYLDLITRKEVVETFEMRSKILKIIRDYLDESRFLEVETPVLQNVYGGADAKPFTTELLALHQKMYLRISLEIPLKKLIVGGLLKVYEIGKVFRNEGIDRTHNPEFTELEAYSAYWDYNDVMDFVERMYEKVALELFKDTKITYLKDGEPIVIDVKTPWKRLTMKESIKKYGNYDVDTLSDKELREILMEKAKLPLSEVKDQPKGLLIAMMFENFVEEHLIQPHHITDHPIETTPLCKLHRDPKEKELKLVERFESFVVGKEIINAYSELNDPELQRKLLEDQAVQKKGDENEPAPLDEDFIEAICYGMPPTGGFGMGVDRMVMLFANAQSIKDVIYFPLMKPEE